MKLLAICILILGVVLVGSCDLFQGPPGEAGLDGADGLPGSDGANGTDGIYLVGGYLTCSIFELPGSTIGAAPAATATLFISFDPDNLLGSGNETIFSIPLGSFISANHIFLYTTFEFIGVPEGDYFVYAWYSQDALSAFDNSMDSSLYFLYTDQANGSYPEFVLDLANSEIDMGTSGDLSPNFTVSNEFTPDIDITIDANFS